MVFGLTAAERADAGHQVAAQPAATDDETKTIPLLSMMRWPAGTES